jgi:hypothetical protein
MISLPGAARRRQRFVPRPMRYGSVDRCADDGMFDAHGVADPHAVNLARW